MPHPMVTAGSASARAWTAEVLEWTALRARLTVPGEGTKGGSCYLLGETADGAHPSNANVVSRWALTLDYDALDGPEALAELRARLRELGWLALAHTTYSSTPMEPRVRVIVALSRSVTPAEFTHLTAYAVGLIGVAGLDVTSDQAARVMFWPVVAPGRRVEYESWEVDGAPLAVDEGLATTPEPLAGPQRASSGSREVPELTPLSELSRADRVERADREADLKAMLEGTPYGIAGAVGALLALGELGAGRNNALNATAYKLGQLSAGGQLDPDAAQEALMDTAGYNGYIAKDGSTEARNTMLSGWSSGLNNPRGPERQDPADVFSPVATDPGQSGGRAGGLPTLDLWELMDPNRPPVEWVVEGLVAAGTVTSLVAPGGMGKSLVALALALSAARGQAWAGLPVPEARRVLYVDMELGQRDLTRRLSSLGLDREQGRALGDRLILTGDAAGAQLGTLDTSEGARQLLEECAARLEPGDLVVLDSAQRVTGGPENDADTAQALYRHTVRELKGLGLTVIITDNTGKDTTRGARGTSSKRDAVDVQLILEPARDDYESEHDGTVTRELRLRVDKSRQGDVERDVSLTVEQDKRESRTTMRVSGVSAVDQAREQVLVACAGELAALGVAVDTGYDRAWEVYREGPGGHTRTTVRDTQKWRRERAGTAFCSVATPELHPEDDDELL